MLKVLIRLSALSLGISCVMCSRSSQTQLASLNERLGQVLSKLYASPLISTKPSAAETEEASNVSPEYPYAPETPYIVSSEPPQVVYVSPSPHLESGAQPNDYGYATETHPVTRATWNYPYAPDLSPPKYPSYPSARSYAEVQRFAFPPNPDQITPPLSSESSSPAQYQSAPYPSPYPSLVPFYASSLPSVAPSFSYSQPDTSIPQSPLQFSPVSPFSYPTTCPSPAPLTGFPLSLSFPSLGSPGFPSSPPASYTSLGTFSFPTLPSPSYPSTASPGLPAFPSLSYPSLASSSFSALPSPPYTTLGSPGLPTFPSSFSPSLGLSRYPALQSPSYTTFRSSGFSALSSPTLPPSLLSLILNSPSIPTPYPSLKAPGNPSPVTSSPSQFSPPAFPKLNELYSSVAPQFPYFQPYSSYPSARSYAEVQRFAFPQNPAQRTPSLSSESSSPEQYQSAPYPSPYPSPVPFYASSLPSVAPSFSYSQPDTSIPQSPLQFSPVSPFSYPTTCPSPAPLTGFPLSLSFPSLGSPGFPSTPHASYTSLGTFSFPTLPSPSYPSTASPGLPAFPSLSYQSLASSGFSALPSPSYTSLGSPGLPTFPALPSPSHPTFGSSGFSTLPSSTLPPSLLSLIPNSPSIPTSYPAFNVPGIPPVFSSPSQFSSPAFPKLNELYSYK